MKSVENPSVWFQAPDPKFGPKKSDSKKNKPSKTFLGALTQELNSSGLAENALAVEEALEKELERRLDEIHTLGQELLKYQSLSTIKAYKEAIKYLVSQFVTRGLEVQEQISGRTILNQKKYSVLKVLDEKLENLVSGLLKHQYKQIEILSKLEEIQGLLINVLH